MGVHHVDRRHFSSGGGSESPPQPDQGAPTERSSQTSSKRILVCQGGGELSSNRHPEHGDAIEVGSTFSRIAGGDDAHRIPASHERPGERAHGSTGVIAWPTGVLVGQENDPHRSVPDVVLL
jgi:hypothetical protein